MTASDRKRRFAINRQLIDKNEAGRAAPFAYGWENVERTIAELATIVSAGVAYAAQLKGKRKAANFLASDIVSVDVDDGMTIEQALAHPLVARHAGLIYTTASHTPAAHRFRVVFPLERTITEATEMRAIARSLALRLSGDPAAVDATRISFGSRGAQTWVLDGQLNPELMDELIAQSINPPVADKATGGALAGARSALKLNPALSITLANGMVMPFAHAPGKAQVFCPFHADDNASAFVVTSQRGVHGLRCSACACTYWPADAADDVDFLQFDRAVRRTREYFIRHRDYGPLGALLDSSAMRVGLLGCNIDINDHEPAPPKLLRGLMLIKSPKGSGKTEALKRLAEMPRRVLLISHRRSLIRQTCNRLNLNCYLDDAGLPPKVIKARQGRYGVCLDSLHRIPWNTRYNIVVLDESEQLLAHFLSDTIEQRRGGGRENIFNQFACILRRAKHVVALDADLGWITYNTLARMMAPVLPDTAQGDLFVRNRPMVRLWLNESKPGLGKNIQLFQSKSHLIADLMEAAVDGKRIFVTSNSKTLINTIAAMISEKTPRIRQIVITADTISGGAQRAFLENARAQALNYDAILASPAVGTGVDVSFPHKAQQIDAVFGFCEANITSHLDFDQQLARVREPGAVKVWINPRRFHFEMNLEAVRQELLEQSLFKNLLINRDGPGGAARYAEDDALIEMASLIVSQQRASKNALRDHFIAHKRWQGFVVDFVEPDDDAKATGKELLNVGKRLGREKYVQRMLAAPPLHADEFARVSGAIEGMQIVTDDEWWSYQRTRIELFYRTPVAADVILRDAYGRGRRRMMLFGAVERAAAGRVPDRARISQLEAAHLVERGYIPPRADILGRLVMECVATGRNPDRGHEQLDRRAMFIRDGDEAVLAITRLLQFTPVMRGPAWGADTVFDGEQLAEFVRFATENKAALENQLGIEFRRDLSVKPVSQLKSVLRLIGLDLAKAGTIKSAGRKIYRYRLDGERLQRIKAVQADRERITGWRYMAALHGWPDQEAEPDDEFEDAA